MKLVFARRKVSGLPDKFVSLTPLTMAEAEETIKTSSTSATPETAVKIAGTTADPATADAASAGSSGTTANNGSNSGSQAGGGALATTRKKRKHGDLQTISRLTTSLLSKQLKSLAQGSVDGVDVWLPDDDLLHWGLTIEGPADTLYEGALFRAELTFPVSYPDQPPEMRFKGVIPYHPNVYPDGRVCISILHPPGKDAVDDNGVPSDEPETERWRPVHGADSVVVSVMSMLSDPNCDSPANVEASVLWREDKAQFKKKVFACVNASVEQ